MKRGNKLSTSDKVFLIALSAFLVAVLWASVKPVSFRQTFGLPFSTFVDLPEQEPTESKICNQIGGICINIKLGCPKGYFEYGSCKTEPIQICCIEDKCRTSGGFWVFESAEYADRGRPSFRTVCKCPFGTEYLAKTGCTPIYE